MICILKSNFLTKIVFIILFTFFKSSCISAAHIEDLKIDQVKHSSPTNTKFSMFSGLVSALALFSPEFVTGVKMAHQRYDPTKKIINVLSIDGGANNGYVPLAILAEIEKITSKPITEIFDVAGGTSIGSLLSTILTTPEDTEAAIWQPKYTATQLNDELNLNIFPSRGFPYPSVYDPINIENLCKKYLKNTTYNQSIIPRLSTTFDLNALATKVFTSDDQEVFMASDIVLSSTAVPLLLTARKIFPINSCNTNTGYFLCDGGIQDKTPDADILAFSRKIFPNAQRINIVSLGCGIVQKSVKDDKFTKNVILSLNSVLNLFLLRVTPYGTQRDPLMADILGDTYIRIDPTINQNVSNPLVDSDEKKQALKTLSVKYLKDNPNLPNKILKLLKR